jgi:predicted GNAT family acetyltransferase
MIEELRMDDWKEYLALRQQLGNHCLDMDRETFLHKYNAIRGQGGMIFVMKIDGQIVATAKLFIEIKFGDNVGHIEDVVVDGEHRRKGYGCAIVKHILLRSYGCYKTILVTNDDLEHFYQRTGMERGGIYMKRMMM